MSRAMALALPVGNLDALRQRVGGLAENRPGVYRMMDPSGRVIYVGKAKKLRARLLTYFRAPYPEDKAARILHATKDIEWQYVHSEFAAYLNELRDIRRFRPVFNVHLKRRRRATFVKILDGPAPKVYHGGAISEKDAAGFGPFESPSRVAEALKTLNDVLGLRDCAATMPVVFADQGDLFAPSRQAACLRHELGFCTGPCAGLVTQESYRQRVDTACAFLEGRTIEPLDRVIDAMTAASQSQTFEQAARWREKFEHLEWLLAAVSRARAAIDLLSFVYRDPGVFGDDRAYLIRRGEVKAMFPYPTTPIEETAFSAVVRDELAGPSTPTTTLPRDSVDEIMLVMSWFRRFPDALRRTTPLEEWATSTDDPYPH
jgi:excinuclease UvrABC nuclease subunit